MSNNIQRIELLDALCERDLADLDLEGLIVKINEKIPHDKIGSALLGLAREALQIAFRTGYYQGARVGMDIASEMFREAKHNG